MGVGGLGDQEGLSYAQRCTEAAAYLQIPHPRSRAVHPEEAFGLQIFLHDDGNAVYHAVALKEARREGVRRRGRGHWRAAYRYRSVSWTFRRKKIFSDIHPVHGPARP